MKNYTFYAYPTHSATESDEDKRIIIIENNCNNVVDAMEKAIADLDKYQDDNNIPDDIRCHNCGKGGSFDVIVMYDNVTGERLNHLSYSEMRDIEHSIRTLNEFKTKM